MIQHHPHLSARNVHLQCLPVIPVLLIPVIPVSLFPVVPVLPFPVTLRALIPNQCLCVRKVKTRSPPLPRAAHQELLSPQLPLRNAGEGGGDRLGEQPIEIQRASSAAPVTPDECWANQRTASHAGATQPQLEDSDPTSSMRTAVYPPSRIVGNSAANENSPFHLGLELGGFPGLYKPAVPDQQQDTTARTLRVKNSGSGISCTPLLASLHTTLLRTTRWVSND